MRRNEGRVVNTPLVFKRVLFQGRKDGKGRKGPGEEKNRERTDGRRRRGDGKEETRGEDRRDGERKGLSPGLEWKDDERRWR
ncbi:hypothetical protein TNCV_4527401 [Trichonephila clavipes]|nr:hypothetical protein TNCV_4527401 [Trichonephila clavipes]